MHKLASLALSIACGCLFNGDETRGWPCDNDDQCGRNETCEMGVCGGLEAAIGTAGSTGSGDSDTNDSTTSTTSTTTSDPSGDVEPSCTIEPRCESSSALRACDMDAEVVISCSDACDTESLGCADSASQGRDICYCGPEFGSCTTEGSRSCNAGALNVCTSGTWEAYDCDALCVADGFYNAYCGSDPDSGSPICLCTDGGCSEGAAYCTSANAVNICNGGVFSNYSCDGLCGGTVSLGCGSSPQGDTCYCGS